MPSLITTLNMAVNEEIKSRVTYSVTLRRLNPEQISHFNLAQLDLCGLAHRTFSPEALDLVIRSAEGYPRRTRNLCVACLLEAVRSSSKIVDLPHVNRVLLQPHWRRESDFLHPALNNQNSS